MIKTGVHFQSDTWLLKDICKKNGLCTRIHIQNETKVCNLRCGRTGVNSERIDVPVVSNPRFIKEYTKSRRHRKKNCIGNRCTKENSTIFIHTCTT